MHAQDEMSACWSWLPSMCLRIASKPVTNVYDGGTGFLSEVKPNSAGDIAGFALRGNEISRLLSLRMHQDID